MAVQRATLENLNSSIQPSKPDSPWLADHMVPISIALALVAMLQFSRTFLELPKRWPRGNLLLLALMAFFVLFGIASMWLPVRIATPVASRAVLLRRLGRLDEAAAADAVAAGLPLSDPTRSLLEPS